MPCETHFDPEDFKIRLSAVVHEEGGEPPQTIIRTDQDWHVHVKWRTTGFITGMIGGDWHLHVMLESVGRGREYNLYDPADHYIALTPGPSPVRYRAKIDVKAGTVHAPKSGMLYRLVVVLTYREPTGDPGPMACYSLEPLILFYQP